MSIWDDLKHFTEKEPWGGNPDLMDRALLKELDWFRHFLECPVIILSALGGQHVLNSMHYQGKAVDIAVPEFGVGLINLYLQATRFKFNGVGVYPNWKYQGKRCGGLHLDVRPIADGGYRAQWLGIKDSKGKTAYLPLNENTIRRYVWDE